MSTPSEPADSVPINAAALEDWITAWAKRVPQLRQVGPGHWRGNAEIDVSYPANGHSALARVEADSYWFNHRNDLISAVVQRFPPGGPMFDVGGGNGYVALGLRDVSVASVVVEPGGHGAATALERGLPVIEAPFHLLQIPADTLPAAGLFDVLEHIDDDRAALASLYEAIEPGGMLYLSVPARTALWSAEDEYAGHYRRYTLSQLKKKVAAAGFTLEYATYFFGILVVPVFLLRSLPSRLGAESKMNDAATVERQHRMPTGLLGRAFRRSFDRERATVLQGGTVAAGTSCLLVARKPGPA